MRDGQHLKGRVALVIGGSRGIGRAIAITLASAGADIAIGYLRNDAAANETARQVKRCGKRVLLSRMNVRSESEISEIFVEINKTYGRLDILVHCAALTIFKPLTELTSLQISRILDTNARAFILTVQQASKLMSNGGVVVAMSSLGSQHYFHRYGGIGIAKACIEASVRYFAVELAPLGIRVNAVSAGPVETDGVKTMPSYEARRREGVKLTPAGRVGTPEDVARVVAFLCRKESDWIRGQTVIADGGLSLRIGSLL